MKIKEVAKKFGISEPTLRYYELEGILTDIPRINGVREYSDENVRVIEFVTCMRSSGMSIERLKEYMKYHGKPNTEKERLQILEDQRKEVEDKIKTLESSIEKLDTKIDYIKKNELKEV